MVFILLPAHGHTMDQVRYLHPNLGYHRGSHVCQLGHVHTSYQHPHLHERSPQIRHQICEFFFFFSFSGFCNIDESLGLLATWGHSCYLGPKSGLAVYCSYVTYLLQISTDGFCSVECCHVVCSLRANDFEGAVNHRVSFLPDRMACSLQSPMWVSGSSLMWVES